MERQPLESDKEYICRLEQENFKLRQDSQEVLPVLAAAHAEIERLRGVMDMRKLLDRFYTQHAELVNRGFCSDFTGIEHSVLRYFISWAETRLTAKLEDA